MNEQVTTQNDAVVHKSALSVWLDFFRWAAAFAVLLAHVSHRVLAHFGDVPHMHKSALAYAVGGISSLGSAAVVIFFVLSGFLVGGGTVRQYRKTGHFGFFDYFAARLSRLWIVLIPVFGISFVMSWIAAEYFIPDGLQAQQVLAAVDLSHLICNIAFLQTAACSQYGGNGALWSLFNEFWYYVAWPPVMLAIWGVGYTRTFRYFLFILPVVALSMLSHWQFVGSNIAVYFGIWLIGVFAADFSSTRFKMPVAPSALIFVATVFVWRLFSSSEVQGTNFWREFPLDLLLAVGFANLVIAMKASSGLRFPPFKRLHQPMAGFSFTLYCIHTPLLNFMGLIMLSLWATGSHMLPSSKAFLIYGANVLICLVVAYLLSLATERHTYQLRILMARKMREVRDYWTRTPITP